MKICVYNYWEASFIKLGIIAEESHQLYCDLTLTEAKELQEKLNKAIKSYETMEQIAQDVCSPDKAESEDSKPSDWMNF